MKDKILYILKVFENTNPNNPQYECLVIETKVAKETAKCIFYDRSESCYGTERMLKTSLDKIDTSFGRGVVKTFNKDNLDLYREYILKKITENLHRKQGEIQRSLDALNRIGDTREVKWYEDNVAEDSRPS